jgi:flagellin-like hook-associated protein FlgL
MALRINTNVPAIRTHSALTASSSQLATSIERLSSGLRINRAADDAAGLTISEKLRRSVRGLNRAVLNAQDGISMIQTAEGALNEVHGILHRMRELTVQSANDTLTRHDRLEIQKEVVQLRDDLNRIAYNTEFNTKKLLDGSQSAWTSTGAPSIQGVVTGSAWKGGDYSVSIALVKAGVSELQRTGIFTVHGGSAGDELARGDTLLVSIAQMYDANGVFVLETSQTLSLSGNGRVGAVVVDAGMTLDALAQAFQTGLTDPRGLGFSQGMVRAMTPRMTGLTNLGGYLEMTSGSIGAAGRLSVSGEQRLIDALGWGILREAEDNSVEVTVTDAENVVRKTQTSDDRASGLLEGVDVQFSSQPAQLAGTRGLEAGVRFTAAQSFTVAAGTASTTIMLAAGAWTMEGMMRSINRQLQGQTPLLLDPIPGLQAVIVDEEIRLVYQRPATLPPHIGTTIRITTASNASTLGFTNGSYSGFVDARKDRTKVEWGFTSYHQTVASGNLTFLRVGDGENTVDAYLLEVIGDTGWAVPDMVRFTDFQQSFNSLADGASVAVRVDQVGGVMAFTSTRVGHENFNGVPSHQSMVTMELISPFAGATVSAGQALLWHLGLEEGTRIGTGDTNTRLHIVDRVPQYHIGPDQYQTMKINIADMSARALGIENLDLTSVVGAERAMTRLNRAIDLVASERAKLGAYQNRLEYAINSLRQTGTNMTAAESRLRDVDMAQETISFTRHQIMSQAAQSMLAQAVSQPQGILDLLRS